MIEPVEGGAADQGALPDDRAPRGALRVGGHTLARHQLALALALGAERVICLAHEGSGGDLIALHHATESAGVLFHRVTGLHGLLALISAQDDVLVLGDGLLAWPDMAVSLLASPGVLVQPVEMGLTAGFERLDFNHASASAMRIPGRLFEALGQMPADIDIFSTLQRLALQWGVPRRELTGDAVQNGRWSLVRNEAEAQAVEPRWIALHAASDRNSAPSAWIAGWGVRSFGPALLHAGSSGTVVAMAAGVLIALALVAGWFAHAALGLGLCVLAAVLFETASLFGRFERRSLLLPRPSFAPTVIYGWLLDGALFLLLALQGHGAGESIIGRIFPPLMLLGLLRLVPQVLGDRRLSAWLSDRAVLGVVLGVAAMGGLLGLAVAAMAVGLLVTGLVAARRASQLTTA